MNFFNPIYYIISSPIVIIILLMIYKLWGVDAQQIILTLEQIKYWENLRSYIYFFIFFYFAYEVTMLLIAGAEENIKNKIINLFIITFIYIVLANYSLQIAVWIKETINIYFLN